MPLLSLGTPGRRTKSRENAMHRPEALRPKCNICLVLVSCRERGVPQVTLGEKKRETRSENPASGRAPEEKGERFEEEKTLKERNRGPNTDSEAKGSGRRAGRYVEARERERTRDGRIPKCPCAGLQSPTSKSGAKGSESGDREDDDVSHRREA
ncbi:unnamed protein product, partial [Soboliphyme baturini]|uniref:RNA recognition motif-containing protein n=1 Tax=Soboliphyme baturini TaxID=241478 RepID=A0A183JB68_9BILA